MQANDSWWGKNQYHAEAVHRMGINHPVICKFIDMRKIQTGVMLTMGS